MAYTKKTTTATTKSADTKATTVTEEVKKEPVKKVEPKKVESKTYAPTDTILCRSITAGGLIMEGKKTKTLYTWSAYGDVAEVEYQDLQSARLSKTRFIFDPLFMIEDDELLAQWKDVQSLYDSMFADGELEAIFDLDSASFQQAVEKLPKGAKESLKTMAVTKIEDGSLDSISQIKAIDVVLGTDLMTYLG